METKPLIMERTYNAPIEKVWQAITDNSKIKQWYFDLEDFRAEVGFTFEFYGDSDCGSYLHYCEVTEVEPGSRITYSWKYKDYEGESYVTWELFPEGDKTRLVLTHRGIENFPQLKDFTRASFTEGWTHFLGKALKEFVEK